MNAQEHTAYTLGIVIPTFNRSAHLKALLEQLKNQAEKSTVRILIVVVNDGSSDQTAGVIAQFGTLVHTVNGSGNWWFTRCAQEGSLYAIQRGCHHIQIINDDSVLEETFLEKTIKHIQESKEQTVFAPLSVTFEKPHRVMFGGVQLRWFGLKRKRTFAPMEAYRPSEKCIPSDVLPGRGMTFSADLFHNIEGFDCKFLQYHSDEDFCLRARHSGAIVCVYTDMVLFAHHELTAAGSSYKRSSLRDLLKAMNKPQSRVYLPDRWRIVRKHHSIFLAPFLFAAHIALILRSNFK
jgi:GT2 family glycosyltransferase